jgi:uncharacterized protein YjaZ
MKEISEGVKSMAVVETDIWLSKWLSEPIKICEKICEKDGDIDGLNLYNYLTQFGMYRPNSSSQNQLVYLKENQTWEKVNNLFRVYKKKWDGPNIPIYIFPLGKGSQLFKSSGNKGGVSFTDKLFLFLSNLEDEKELEALFIHEYHHICRLNGITKSVKEYNLLDSLVLEGLAEDAVHEILGSKYVANWNKKLTGEQFKQYWHKYLEGNLNAAKGTKLHDQLLFGKGLLPKMLGYSCGYYLVRAYRQQNSYTTKETFRISSENFVKNVRLKA